MNEATIELLSELSSFERALRDEGFSASANILAGHVRKFEKGTAALGEPVSIEWAAVAKRLEDRAGMLHKENAALTATARNTPYGVMTGTTTILLSMLAEAIGVGMGQPTQARIDEALTALREDRSKHILAKITGAVNSSPDKNGYRT